MEFLRSKLMGPSSPGMPERIYISREDSQNGRRLTNEAELFERLEGLGFVRVVLSRLSHAQQVGLFTSAKIIVGVQGAGMVNHIFAPEDAHVIELHPRSYTNRAHFFTTNALDQTYQFVICDEDLMGSLTAPISRVIRCVERVL